MKPELVGQSGNDIAFPLSFEPYALLPKGSLIIVRGLPPTITLSEGVSRESGVWIVNASDASDLNLHMSNAKPGRYKIVVYLVGSDGARINQANSLLIITPGNLDISEANAGPPAASSPEVVTLPSSGGERLNTVKNKAVSQQAEVQITHPQTSTVPLGQTDRAVIQNSTNTAIVDIVRKPPSVPAFQSDELSSKGAAPKILSRGEAAKLVERGRARIALGDIALARLLFKRAAQAGNANAAFALAETFDPNQIKLMGVIGLAGAPKRARYWYLQASTLDQRLRIEDRLALLPDP